MTYRQGGSSGAKNRLTISMIVGTLLVPISAIAAILLADPGQPAQGETVPSATTTSPDPATVDVSTSFKDAGATVGDLRAACGYVGMTLVDAERNGTITDIQQAALDALRDVCDEQGLSLPAAPTPDETVQTVVVEGSTSNVAGTTTTAPGVSSQHHEDSEYEGESDDEGDG